MLLRYGDTGPEVVQLQRLLANDWSFAVGSNGQFDRPTQLSVRQFQAIHHDQRGGPLVIDGEVGPLTWWALTHRAEGSPQGKRVSMPVLKQSGIRFKALHQAKYLLGKGEQGGNNHGPFVADCLKPVGLVPPQPWCAAFVSYCFLQACGGNAGLMPFRYSAKAHAILNIGQKKAWGVQQPLPGDLIIWSRGPINHGHGHIGFVEEVRGGQLYTIEGNNNPQVGRFEYVLGHIQKLINLIRVSEDMF